MLFMVHWHNWGYRGVTMDTKKSLQESLKLRFAIRDQFEKGVLSVPYFCLAHQKRYQGEDVCRDGWDIWAMTNNNSAQGVNISTSAIPYPLSKWPLFNEQGFVNHQNHQDIMVQISDWAFPTSVKDIERFAGDHDEFSLRRGNLESFITIGKEDSDKIIIPTDNPQIRYMVPSSYRKIDLKSGCTEKSGQRDIEKEQECYTTAHDNMKAVNRRIAEIAKSHDIVIPEKISFQDLQALGY